MIKRHRNRPKEHREQRQHDQERAEREPPFDPREGGNGGEDGDKEPVVRNQHYNRVINRHVKLQDWCRLTVRLRDNPPAPARIRIGVARENTDSE